MTVGTQAAPSWFSRIISWAHSQFVKQPWVTTCVYAPGPYAKAGCAVVLTVPQATDAVLELFDPNSPTKVLPKDVQVIKLPMLARTFYTAAGVFDFSVLDQIIAFWAARGKTVIPCVGCWFFQYPDPNGVLLPGGTPDWMLAATDTYQYAARILKEGVVGFTTCPDFRDTKFAALVNDLTKLLAEHYDGMPGLSHWQIATGNGGEDGPPFGLFDGPKWFTPEDWLVYCERTIPTWLEAFKKTPLRYDLGRLAWIQVSVPALAPRVQVLFDAMLAADVLLSCDGWDSTTLNKLADPKAEAGITLRALMVYQSKGGKIAIEAIGPMFRPDMQDGRGLLRAIGFMKPDMVTLFSDWATSPIRTMRLGGKEAAPKT